jgi:hypothetical protein
MVLDKTESGDICYWTEVRECETGNKGDCSNNDKEHDPCAGTLGTTECIRGVGLEHIVKLP